MIDSLLVAFWFFLPAGVANMTPVLANYVPPLNNWKTPLDFGYSYRGKRIFGDNKTWRGFVMGIFTGGLTGFLVQETVYGFVDWPQYLVGPGIALGAVMGGGALLGDAAESFFKRQRGIGPGKSWYPFDQIDYIIGGLFFVAPFTYLTLSLITWVLVVYFGLHVIIVYVFYRLGVRDKPI